MDQSFEKILVEQCAPTLAGIKPASLFRVHGNGKVEIYEVVRYWNEQLKRSGTHIRLLQECCERNSYLVIAYRKHWLSQIIMQKETKEFLEKNGYIVSPDSDFMLKQISDRLCKGQEFPHEVGLLLGYPLGDVIGFIQNKGKQYSSCGCWKVYENSTTAINYFTLIRECTAHYKNMYNSGTPIVRMVSSSSQRDDCSRMQNCRVGIERTYQ